MVMVVVAGRFIKLHSHLATAEYSVCLAEMFMGTAYGGKAQKVRFLSNAFTVGTCEFVNFSCRYHRMTTTG
jgi:hypothetical protein